MRPQFWGPSRPSGPNYKSPEVGLLCGSAQGSEEIELFCRPTSGYLVPLSRHPSYPVFGVTLLWASGLITIKLGTLNKASLVVKTVYVLDSIRN